VLASFAKDSYELSRTPLPLRRKAGIWANLLRRSGRFQGFDIAYLDHASYMLAFREIFARQHYYFRPATDAPVIFDCGANLGLATIYFKWLYPLAKIHAFEPDPTTFKVLERNIAANHLGDVTAHNCALWDSDTEIQFFTHKTVPGSLRMSTNSGRIDGTESRVPGRRLSAFINQPVDLLKIDVEGAEHRVICELLSSGKLSTIRQLVIEYHHHIGGEPSRLASFLEMLERAGFDYQLSAAGPSAAKEQDILIGASSRL
jgi:FkbM family methyltransferase